jgi:hypothetical protein
VARTLDSRTTAVAVTGVSSCTAASVTTPENRRPLEIQASSEALPKERLACSSPRAQSSGRMTTTTAATSHNESWYLWSIRLA